MAFKKLVGGYLAMVGIPLLIILFVLDAGSEITPPPAIDGAWVLAPAPGETPEVCREALAAFDGCSLVISQSGRRLTARWSQGPAEQMDGAIDRDGFILCSLGRSGEQCSLDPLHLDGRILDESGSRRLEVRLSPRHGGECGELLLVSASRPIQREARAPKGYNY